MLLRKHEAEKMSESRQEEQQKLEDRMLRANYFIRYCTYCTYIYTLCIYIYILFYVIYDYYNTCIACIESDRPVKPLDQLHFNAFLL